MLQVKGIKLDLYTLLEELIEDCKHKGVIFEEKDFKSVDDVKMMSEQHIVNCLGCGSK